MATFSWAKPVGGDWNTAADWSPATVPNDPLADVTIDAPATAAYAITIAAGENETVHSLTINGVNDLAGSNTNPYIAAEMAINGTLTFGAGSPGLLGGSLQTFITMNGGTIVNPGTVDAFIQAQGNVLLTGTNGIYITNWLQSLGGIVTIDTKSIAETTGTTLFDGIFEAQGQGAVVNLGGPRQNLIVNIATVEGPAAIPSGWTELIFNGAVTEIGEWNGTSYVAIESTLTNIGARGTVDVLGGRNYITANTLSIASTGLLNLRAGTVSTAGLDINGGTVQGSGTINSGVVNNGTLRALDGILTVGTGGLVGTGLVTFDFDQKAGTIGAGAVMEVHGVGPGQTFVMNGDDQLVIDTLSSFAGTIQAKPGDNILLGGVQATSATLNGQTLTLQNNGQTVGSLSMGGSYTGDFFTVVPLGGGSSSEVEIRAPAFGVQDTTTGTTTVTPGTDYTGPIGGLQHEYINPTTDSLNVTATAPNVFISTGAGNDALNVSGVNGNNVLNAGGGSNFLTGGTGDDTFYVDVRGATSTIFSTIAGFHSGDNATVFGVIPADFTVATANNVGAPGYTGLAFAFSAPGQPTANLVLAGYSSADLSDGKLTQSYGTEADGTPYLLIHAT